MLVKMNAKKDVKLRMLLTDYICNKKMKDNYNMLLLSCYFLFTNYKYILCACLDSKYI